MGITRIGSVNSGVNVQDSIRKRRETEPAKSYLWLVVLPDLTDVPQPSNTPTMQEASRRWNQGINRNIDSSFISMLVTDINTPHFSVESDKVTDGSTFWYEAKHNDIADITMTIEEQESGIVYNYLNNWFEMIVNPDGTYNPPHFYKRDIHLYRLDMSKNEFQVFKYKNYFITEVAPLSNSYQNSEAVTYEVSFSGDSLDSVVTVRGSELNQALEQVSLDLDIDIDYNRFDFAGVPSPAVAGVLNQIGRQVL